MGAKIFINGDKDHGMPWAVEYYLRVENHIVAVDKSVKRVKVTDYFPFHFKNLVEAIDRNCQPGDDVGIVCHGIPEKLGVTPSISGSFWAEVNFARRMSVLDPDLSTEMGLSDAQFEEMTDRLMRIRKLRLNHIMVQACRVGRAKNFLLNFADIFRARSISAPTLKTVYGNCEVYQAPTKAIRDKFHVEYPHFFDVPVSNGRTVTLASKRLARSKYDVVMLTDTWDTLMRFATDNFPSIPNLGNLSRSPLRNFGEVMLGVAKPALFPFHGLISRESPYKFYFPKDPRYAAAVTHVKC